MVKLSDLLAPWRQEREQQDVAAMVQGMSDADKALLAAALNPAPTPTPYPNTPNTCLLYTSPSPRD